MAGKPKAKPEWAEAALARLHSVAVLSTESLPVVPLSHGPTLAEIATEPRNTPSSLAPEHILDGKSTEPALTALMAASAFVDAVLLRCPGTDDGRSMLLVEELFERQAQHGLFRLSEKDGRPPLNDHPWWDAAMAAVLYVAHHRNLPGIEAMAAGWWRQVIDEATRDENAVHGTHASRLAIVNFVRYGIRDASLAEFPTYTGALLFYLLENIPLPLPARPFPAGR